MIWCLQGPHVIYKAMCGRQVHMRSLKIPKVVSGPPMRAIIVDDGVPIDPKSEVMQNYEINMTRKQLRVT